LVHLMCGRDEAVYKQPSLDLKFLYALPTKFSKSKLGSSIRLH